MRSKLLPIIMLLIAFSFGISNLYACENDPNCNCDKVKVESKKKSCGFECKDNCLDGIKLKKDVCHPNEHGYLGADGNQYGNVWKTEDGVELYICPVMKDAGQVKDAVSYSEINGIRYFHCCPDCEKPFQANSSKYIKELVLPGNVNKVDSNGLMYFVDPVNHKKGTVDKKTRYVDLDGKRFYFESKKSQKSFKKHPESYAHMM